MTPASGLMLYNPNVQLFSDNATKIRYMSVPYDGGNITPDQQINFAPTGAWTFPAGTVFVKTFELQTNLTDPTPSSAWKPGCWCATSTAGFTASPTSGVPIIAMPICSRPVPT